MCGPQHVSQIFQHMKALLLSAPVLVAIDFTRQFILLVKTSNIGAGAILKQQDENKINHCVSFFKKIRRSSKELFHWKLWTLCWLSNILMSISILQ